MNRRSFIAMTPAFPVAAVSASLTLRKDGEPPIEGLDVSILKLQAGDTIILRSNDHLSSDAAQRIRSYLEAVFPGTKALIIDAEMTLAGVIRGIEG